MSARSGRVIVVTGGSAGIGLAVCRKLANDGATVVMVARTASTVEREAAAIGAVPWPLDVGDLTALAALPAAVVERCGRLDAIVNNAGVHHRGRVDGRTTEQLAQMVHVNLTAPIVLSRAALDHLPAGGAIVQVASLAGRLPLQDAATYSATKAGLRFFTRALADERKDLVIGTVSPGPVDTGFFGEDLSQVSDMVFSQPMSTADEVADAVIAVMDRGGEVSLPASSGALTTLGYLIPGLSRALRPTMLKRGAAAKKAYGEKLARRQ
ncbi:MAG: SDR family oxidoreductase [Alphaproteobacteria bacterium]|nr:SDR family oxidoreductase [Alphaproteobacteria bacterium]